MSHAADVPRAPRPPGPRRLIFDSHLDLSWNALSYDRDLTLPLEALRRRESALTDHPCRARATVSLPELRDARIFACCATLLARTNPAVPAVTRMDLDCATQSITSAIARGQLEYYRLLQAAGHLHILLTRSDLQHHHAAWKEGEETPPLGIILAMEGADPITSPAQVELWYARGLRSLGLAHYGPSAYAHGTASSGPLSPAGVELLRRMSRLPGLTLDLTHSADPSFFQALDLFDGPVMASHNNCRALVPGDRQFSDEQIKLLIQRNAVIGVAFDAWMLAPGYIRHGQSPRPPISAVADQIDHLCQLAGNTRHAAIGSDLDGGYGTEQTPAELDTIADLHRLAPLLEARGYSSDDLDQIFHLNWLGHFLAHLPS